MLTDSHCHLQAAEFDVDRDAVLARARAAGVDRIVCPSTDARSCRAGIALARLDQAVAPAAGLHPNSVASVPAGEWDEIRALAREPEVIAIGETGLDYYRGAASAAEQRSAFVRHLGLAAELALPVIVHNRDADDDVLRAIADWRSAELERIAVLHCFVGDPDFAARAIELGCYLGIGGPVTFKTADQVRRTVETIPIDRLLLETDAPFLAPAPHRGSRNEPAFVRWIAERVALVRGLGIDALARATTNNAARVFGQAAGARAEARRGA